LGLLGYELLTGAGPFHAVTPHELIAAHLRDTPRRLRAMRSDVDAELDALIARCLDKDSSKRPKADEVARRLGSGGGGLLEWPPPGLDKLVGGLGRAARWYWVGTICMLVAALPLLLAGSRLDPAGQSIGATLLLILCLLGLAVFVGAAALSARLGSTATGAVRNGFGWMTVLEVLADPQSDTGNLLAGTGRFAAVDAAIRSRMRGYRVAHALLLLSGSVLSLLTLVLIIVLGSAGFVSPQA